MPTTDDVATSTACCSRSLTVVSSRSPARRCACRASIAKSNVCCAVIRLSPSKLPRFCSAATAISSFCIGVRFMKYAMSKSHARFSGIDSGQPVATTRSDVDFSGGDRVSISFLARPSAARRPARPSRFIVSRRPCFYGGNGTRLGVTDGAGARRPTRRARPTPPRSCSVSNRCSAPSRCPRRRPDLPWRNWRHDAPECALQRHRPGEPYCRTAFAAGQQSSCEKGCPAAGSDRRRHDGPNVRPRLLAPAAAR
jgi:hypothetical protein